VETIQPQAGNGRIENSSKNKNNRGSTRIFTDKTKPFCLYRLLEIAINQHACHSAAKRRNLLSRRNTVYTLA
jgi:hypothetical protein